MSTTLITAVSVSTVEIETKTCICCGAKLSPAIKHAQNALGPLGPTCAEKYDMDAVFQGLKAADLGKLVGGKIHLDWVSTGEEAWTQHPDVSVIVTKAQRLGLPFTIIRDVATKQSVISIKTGKGLDKFLSKFPKGEKA